MCSHANSAGGTTLASSDLQARLRVLAASQMFAGVPAETQASVASVMHERQVARGQDIFCESDEATALFAVLAGEVQIVIGGDSGRRHVLRTLSLGDLFGEIAVLDGERHNASARAVTKCRLLLLERRQLLALIAQQPAVALSLIGILCQRLRVTSAQMESLLFTDLATRLACVLLERVQGRKAPSINITQAELGELTGVSRESVNKKLRVWQAAGLVALQPGRVIVLDPAGLMALSK